MYAGTFMNVLITDVLWLGDDDDGYDLTWAISSAVSTWSITFCIGKKEASCCSHTSFKEEATAGAKPCTACIIL